MKLCGGFYLYPYVCVLMIGSIFFLCEIDHCHGLISLWKELELFEITLCW